MGQQRFLREHFFGHDRWPAKVESVLIMHRIFIFHAVHACRNLRGILSMATEKSGAEFPPKIVEVAHLDDTDVKTPQPPKLEDMVEPNQNSFTALESGTSTKIEAESTAEAVKNLDLKVCEP